MKTFLSGCKSLIITYLANTCVSLCICGRVEFCRVLLKSFTLFTLHVLFYFIQKTHTLFKGELKVALQSSVKLA